MADKIAALAPRMHWAVENSWGPCGGNYTWARAVRVLPHGPWITHRGSSDEARIFQITDRELFRRLDFLRDETTR